MRICSHTILVDETRPYRGMPCGDCARGFPHRARMYYRPFEVLSVLVVKDAEHRSNVALVSPFPTFTVRSQSCSVNKEGTR